MYVYSYVHQQFMGTKLEIVFKENYEFLKIQELSKMFENSDRYYKP